MSPTLTDALLLAIAARLEVIMAGLHVSYAKVFLRSQGRLHINTISRVMHGKGYRLATLVTFADALDCDVTITITPRAHPQELSHKKLG